MIIQYLKLMTIIIIMSFGFDVLGAPKKVLFLVHTETVGGKGVYDLYREMKKVGHDVKIIAIPSFYNGSLLAEVDLNFTQKFDVQDVIYPCGKSAPYKHCDSIHHLKADYLFIQNPYNAFSNSVLDPKYLIANLKTLAKKIMYVVYGPHLFHQDTINDPNLPKVVDTVFVDSESTKKIYINKFKFPENRVVVSGFQSYKEVRDGLKKERSAQKKETILWLPRWLFSAKGRDLFEGGSTFLTYYHFIYNYAKENPQINFIIRPHVLLFSMPVQQKFLSQEELDNIFDKFRALSNVTVSMHKNRPLSEDVLASDIIISDGTSALGEVVVADKPVIYLSNGWNNEFNSNSLSRELKKYIYLAYDPGDVIAHLDAIRKSNYHPYLIDSDAIVADKVRALKQSLYDMIGNHEMMVKVLSSVVIFAEENAPLIYTKITLVKCWLFGQSCSRNEFKKLLDPVENPAEYMAHYLLEH